MALSVTWYAQADYPLDDAANHAVKVKSTLFALKAYLLQAIVGPVVGVAGAPSGSQQWGVEGSSDGSDAGMDETDRLGFTFTPASYVRAASNGSQHSWIVLSKYNFTEFGGEGTQRFYLLLSMLGASNEIRVSFSPNPFTGGSPTTDPTSTGERSFVWKITNTASTGNGKAHLMTDNKGNFLFLMSSNDDPGKFESALYLGALNRDPADPTAFDVFAFASNGGSSARGCCASDSETGPFTDGILGMSMVDGVATAIAILFELPAATRSGVVEDGGYYFVPSVFVFDEFFRGAVRDFRFAFEGMGVGGQALTNGTDQFRICVGDLLVPCDVATSVG